MRSCWSVKPEERPSFSALIQQFQEIATTSKVSPPHSTHPSPPHSSHLHLHTQTLHTHAHTTYLCMDPHTLTSSPTYPPQVLPSLTTYNPTPTTSPSHKPVSPTKKPKYRARRPHTCVQKTTSAMVLLIDPPSPDHDKVPGYHETDV